jgi:hypothetical protein
MHSQVRTNSHVLLKCKLLGLLVFFVCIVVSIEPVKKDFSGVTVIELTIWFNHFFKILHATFEEITRSETIQGMWNRIRNSFRRPSATIEES